MSTRVEKSSAQVVWNMDAWATLEKRTRARALAAGTEQAAWRVLAREAQRVMRAYTTSFFIVSRFLPLRKRREVEAVYAAVRYPDEIVDTFPLTTDERIRLLDQWQSDYETGLRCATLAEALSKNVPCFLAAFTKVVRERSIPAEYYRAFLDAMRRDTKPGPFGTLDDLIENYIYGSAVVVGYFLTYIYGARSQKDFGRALASARALGIALQLTNFLRDVAEDQRRGRVYLPQDVLRSRGIVELADFDTADQWQQSALAEVVQQLAGVAASYYALAAKDLDAFSPDCQLAIQACIKVYGRLNERIASSSGVSRRRESVPLREKFQALPPSKYWRIPLAYFVR